MRFLHLGACICTVAALLVSACSNTVDIGAPLWSPDAGKEDFGNPVHTGVDASRSDGGLGALCPTNKCPVGHVTCPSNPFPCAVDLLEDKMNCGACGSECPDSGSSIGLCVEGLCRFKCKADYLDCNKLTEDTCETPPLHDTDNCGRCGNACPAKHTCILGKCECTINNSCGECGRVCPPPDPDLPEFPSSWHVHYGCGGGACNQPICDDLYEDCNGDFNPLDLTKGDGCEAKVRGDSKNCGACAKACPPGFGCYFDECVCPCGASCFDSNKLIYDPVNCGTCGIACPGIADENGLPVCKNGACDYLCISHHEDCDGYLENGCEVNLWTDPFNCGACDHRCDAIEGQACVDGQCTAEECTIK